LGDGHPAILALNLEVAPARMERNVERRIGFPRDRCGEDGAHRKLVQIDAEIVELAGDAGLEDHLRALAHGGRSQQ
jgi:hypothetical protein